MRLAGRTNVLGIRTKAWKRDFDSAKARSMSGVQEWVGGCMSRVGRRCGWASVIIGVFWCSGHIDCFSWIKKFYRYIYIYIV
jgi:hypothetical protein